jgi:aryl-alcohol dehydrogenase-like predicted oxidoreductase
MEYVKLPGTDVTCSRVTLGTWAIGGWMWGGTDEKRSIETIHAALDKGVNTIDTAPVYGFGTSEEIVGKAVESWSGKREDVNLSTKVALQWDDEGQVFRNSTPERIRKEINDSLERLRTDYIDIYYIHWPDPLVPVEETAGEMKRLLDEGKVRALGVSNYSVEQIDSFRTVVPLSIVQPPYNIFERGIEDDIKPHCRENDIALMTYGALCRGMLSGKMHAGREFKGDDLRKVDPKFQEPLFSQYLEAAERLAAFAREKHGKNLLELAVRWVLDQGSDIALWGGRKPEQLDPLPEVFGWNLSKEDMEAIDSMVSDIIERPVGPEFMAPPSREGMQG